MEIKNDDFKQYQLSSEITEALLLLGYKTPTKVQKEVIPLILKGKDIAAKSQTGTGKTAAFAIPACEMAKWEENLPQILVLEPTRELSVQVRDEIFYIGRKKRLKVPAVFGGFPIDKQIQTLKQKSHIVVGTPGRVMDHIRRDTLKLSKVRMLVIDEADLMLDMGFLEEVRQIIEKLPANRQILLFSATLGERIGELVSEYLSDAVYVILEDEKKTAELVEQNVCQADSEEKYDIFLDILIKENPESCMIFCGTREMVNVLYHKLLREKAACGMLHGEMDQRDRLRTIEDFRSGRFRCLIATDVAARGIDFDQITHVINYDFPTGRETYVHRIGRTGRNGKHGKAISLVTADDLRMKKMVEEYLGTEIPEMDRPVREEADEKAFWKSQKQPRGRRQSKGAALNNGITRLSVGGGKKSKMRAVDIVGTICSIDGIEASDIGIIDIRDSLTHVEILNGKGKLVLEALQTKTIKGKIRKVRITRN